MLPKMRACVRTWGHGIDTIGIRTRKIPAMNDHASDFRNHFPKWGRTRTGRPRPAAPGFKVRGFLGLVPVTIPLATSMSFSLGLPVSSQLKLGALSARWLHEKAKEENKRCTPARVTGGPLRPPSRAECHQWGRARALAPAAFISNADNFGGRAAPSPSHWQPEATCARPAAPFKLPLMTRTVIATH